MTAQQLIDTVQQLQANMQQAQQRELTLRQQVEQLTAGQTDAQQREAAFRQQLDQVLNGQQPKPKHSSNRRRFKPMLGQRSRSLQGVRMTWFRRCAIGLTRR